VAAAQEPAVAGAAWDAAEAVAWAAEEEEAAVAAARHKPKSRTNYA